MRTRILSFFVFLGLCFGTLLAYQEWHNQFVQQEYLDVLEMSETSKIQHISSPAGKSLVPTGSLLGVNEIDEVFLTYLVDIESDQTVEIILADVIFSKDNMEVRDLDHLINISYSVETIGESQAAITVCVSLNMPESQLQYEAVSGSQLSLVLDFVRK